MDSRLTNKVVAYVLIGAIIVFVGASTFVPGVEANTEQLLVLSGLVATLLGARQASEGE